MNLFDLLEAPSRMVFDGIFAMAGKGSKSSGSGGGGGNYGNSNFFSNSPQRKTKTGYGKKYPNYSDRAKNMANASRIKENFSGKIF